MADITRTVEVIFGSRDDLSGSVNSMLGDISKFSSELGSLTGPIAGFTTDLLKIEAGIAAVGAAFLAVAYNQAVDLESAFFDLRKVLGENETALDSYTETLAKHSDTYGVSGVEATQAAADFKQAGFTIGQSLDLVKQSMIAAKISELDAGEAASYLVSQLKGFGEDASNASRYLDVMNGLSNNFATSLGELAFGLSKVAPLAQSTGLSYEEMASYLVPVIEVTRSGAQAADGLRTTLVNLGSQMPKIKDQMDELGIAQFDLNGELRPARDILEDLGAKWNSMTDLQQQNIGVALAGQSHYSKFRLIMENMDTVQRAYNVALESSIPATDGLTSSTRELEIRMASAQEQINIATTRIGAMTTAIGMQFKDEMTGAISSVGELATSFKNVVNTGGLEPLFDLLRPLLDEFRDKILKIAAILPDVFSEGNLDFSGFVAGFEELGLSISGIFGNVDLTTPEGLTLAIQKLIDVGAGLLQWTASVVDTFQPMIAAVASMASGFAGLDSDTQSLIGSVMGWVTQLDILLPLLSAMASAVTVAAGAYVLLAGKSGIGAAIGAITDITSAAGSLSSVLGKAGMLGLFTALAVEIVDVSAKAYALSQAWDAEAQAVKDNEAQHASLAERLKQLSDDTGLAITSQEELHSAIKSGALILDTAAGSWVNAATAVGDLDDAIAKGKVVWNDAQQQYETTAEATRDYDAEVRKAATEGTPWFTDAIKTLSETLPEMKGALGEAEVQVAKTGEATKDAAFNMGNLRSAALDVTHAVAEFGSDSAEAAFAMVEFENAMNMTAGATDKFGSDMEDAVQAVLLYEAETANAKSKTDDLASSHVNVAEKVRDTAKTFDDWLALLKESNDAALKATQEAHNFEIEMEKIASNERIANIEAKVSIDVAQIQADAAIVEAAFDSINVGLESTADVITGLSGELAELLGGDWAQQRAGEELMKIIKEQTKLQEQEFEVQKKLIEAQIKLAQEKAASLARGDALITVDAASLEPELEMVMYKILQNIQVRASAEGQAWLFGC